MFCKVTRTRQTTATDEHDQIRNAITVIQPTVYNKETDLWLKSHNSNVYGSLQCFKFSLTFSCGLYSFLIFHISLVLYLLFIMVTVDFNSHSFSKTEEPTQVEAVTKIMPYTTSCHPTATSQLQELIIPNFENRQ